MSLLFPFAHVGVQQPVLTLGGRWVRPRPLVGVTVIGPTDSRFRRALLDTGADDSIFPESLAPDIGIDLSNAPIGQVTRVTTGGMPLRYAEVLLRITDGREQREWRAWVGFAKARLYYPLLGFAGCLQFFTTSFRGDREEVELSINGLYRGT